MAKKECKIFQKKRFQTLNTKIMKLVKTQECFMRYKTREAAERKARKEKATHFIPIL